jgi:membrane associated rhomboid family serine protease
MTAFAPSQYSHNLVDWGVLDPKHIRHGWVWQFITYGFIHFGPLGFLLAMLSIYFLGSAVEDRIGSQRFYELFFTALVGAGVLGFLLSFTRLAAQGQAWGSGAAANAILMVFFLLYRDAPIMLFPIPIPIPVKWIVIFTAAVQAAYLLLTHFALFFTVQLLGLGVGFVWYRVLARQSLTGFLQGQVVSVRNRYYRWKRDQAKKKFQVYMRKHQQDPKQYFDEYGNFRPPDEKEKDKKDGPGGWVN